MGSENGAASAAAPELDASDVARKVMAVRTQVRESFGKIAMAMMAMPRYRHQSIADLQHLVLEPLIRDRVAIAYPRDAQKEAKGDLAGVAIWASVSDEVDAKIREQIQTGTFPVRLKPEDWQSGETNWLLDIISPDRKTTVSVLSNFKQVIKDGELRLHPIVTQLLDDETLEKLGASRTAGKSPEA